MDSKTNLEVGDVIYKQGTNGSLTYRLEVERITKTMAVSGNFKFKNMVSRLGYVTPFSQARWDTSCWKISNPELEKQWHRQSRLRHVNNFNYSLLSDEKLEAIISIIEPNQGA